MSRVCEVDNNLNRDSVKDVVSGIAACSFLKPGLPKQLHTWHCTSLGPQQYIYIFSWGI